MTEGDSLGAEQPLDQICDIVCEWYDDEDVKYYWGQLIELRRRIKEAEAGINLMTEEEFDERMAARYKDLLNPSEPEKNN
jgi:hypothetical protein